MEEEVLSKLVEFVEMASPQVWAIAQRQVYVNIFQSILWGVVCLIGSIILARLASSWWAVFKKDNDADYGMMALAAGVVVVVLSFAVITQCYNLIGPVINPQYYAVKVLLGLVK